MAKQSVYDERQEREDRMLLELAHARKRATAALEVLSDGSTPAISLGSLGLRGRRGCPHNCVLAQYLNRRVGGYRFEIAGATVEVYGWWGRLGTFRLNATLTQFIADFDNGEYPSLDNANAGTASRVKTLRWLKGAYRHAGQD